MHLVGQSEGREYQLRHVFGRRYEYTDPGTEDWRPIWLATENTVWVTLTTDPTVVRDPNLPRDTARAINLKRGRHLTMRASWQKEDAQPSMTGFGPATPVALTFLPGYGAASRPLT